MSKPLSESNPFATRFTRPGAIPFRFRGELSTGSLIQRLSDENWWGAIVGPHGSGKSSLLAELIPMLQKQGRTVCRFALRDRQRRIPELKSARAEWNASTLVIVDGFEQLAMVRRWELRRHCCRGGCGLLVTAHHEIRGIKTLVEIKPDLETVLDIVATLTDGRPQYVRRDDVAKAFQDHQGNVRETLFDLYDLFHQRSR